MVYYGGIEPLKEIEALIVKFKMSRYFFNEDSDCLEILFEEWVQEKIENIIKKYHIDELSPREMAERIPKKDKIK